MPDDTQQRHYSASIERAGAHILITSDDPSAVGWAERVLTALSRRAQQAGHLSTCRHPAIDLSHQLDLHDLADRVEQLVRDNHHRSREGLLVSWLADTLGCSRAEVRGAAECSARMDLVTHAAGISLRWECVRLRRRGAVEDRT